MRVTRVTEGHLPVIGHHTSDPGNASAADDAVLYGTTIPAAGRPGPTGGPMDVRDAAAYACRASCKLNSDVSLNRKKEDVRKFLLRSLNT